MHHRAHSLNHRLLLARLLAVTLAMLLGSVMAGGLTAHAKETRSDGAPEPGQARFNIKPVGVDGSYFDLTMSPGESRQLTVAFGNYGTRDAVAMVYPADTYSLVNGGMGVRLAGESISGTTEWVGFEAETFRLAAGEVQLRTFAASVPTNADAGEYLTSLVIQDDALAATDEAGGVAATRINRQVIAVAITVPGPVAAGLTLGPIEHHLAGGRSVITVAVENHSNIHLQPRGELTMTDSTGEHTRFKVVMDSVYAGTSTLAEISFTTLLAPGEYHVNLTLSDGPHAITATTGTTPLAVPASTSPILAAPVSPNLATMAQPATTVVTRGDEGGWLRFVPVLVTGILALTFGNGVVAWRARPHCSAVPAGTPATPMSQSTTIVRSVAIRQLAVPNRSAPSHGQHPPPVMPRFKKLDAGSRLAAASSQPNGD